MSSVNMSKGTVYLIHFDTPIGDTANKHGYAQHYIGWSSDLQARINEHKQGQGAKIIAWCVKHAITWHVARTWPNSTRNDERKLKNQKNAKRLCPICKGSR